jgi:hypothetical protein
VPQPTTLPRARTGKGTPHNVFHKTTKELLRNILKLPKKGNKFKLVKIILTEFQEFGAHCVWVGWIIIFMTFFINNIGENRDGRWILVEVFRVEF